MTERLIKILAYRTAKIIRNKDDPHGLKISYYSFQGIYGDLLKFIIAILISTILGFGIETLVVILTFMFFRIIAGGYHSPTYRNCFYITVGIFVLIGFLTKIMNNNLIIGYNIITIITNILLLIAIIYSPNIQELTEYQINLRKFLSIIYIVILAIIAITFNKITWAILNSLMLESLVITPFGHWLFGKIDYIISRRS